MSESHSDETQDVAPDELLRVFEALRARPETGDLRTQRRLERLAARRLPPVIPDKSPRGDIAEPPPVLDLELTDPADREHVIHLLQQRCGNHPVWVLPHGSARATKEPPENEQGEEADDGEQRSADTNGQPRHDGSGQSGSAVSTRELYKELHRLTEGFDNAPGGNAHRRGRQAPPAPRFRRLRSLLLLNRVDLRAVYTRKERLHDEPEKHKDVSLPPKDRESEGAVIEALREVRAGLKNRSSDDAPWWSAIYSRVLRRVSALVARVSALVTFGKLDEKVLTPVSFVVSAIVTAAPIASLSLLFEQLDNLVTVGAAVLLLLVYTVLALFLFLPWHRFRWLNRHRYPLEPGQSSPRAPQHHQHSSSRESDQSSSEGLRNHRQRGIRVLNVLYKHRDATVDPDSGHDWNPPGIHRLGVNAFLDDLDRVYGNGHLAHRWLPRRRRHRRPVLLVDQERVGNTGRYLVRLIEDERLRRRYPDPLLIVVVRTTATPMLASEIQPEHHPVLPEARGKPASDHRRIVAWRNARHAHGTLGRERLLTFPIRAGTPEVWKNAYREKRPDSVWTPLALTGFWSAGVGTTAVLALVAGNFVVPAYVQANNPCVKEGVRPPSGIQRKGQECIGITDGGFFFDDRLENAQDVIRGQNDAVAGEDHVTIVYIASMSVTTRDNNGLAGVQGELYGLAERQKLHNRRDDVPAIRLLLANTGQNWAHAQTVADQIVRRAGDDHATGDRILAAVGLGHSVRPNTRVITTLSAAQIPMVGTTATFDEVAHLPTGRPSPYFFPVAPSNSRIAERAAQWAHAGVRWSSDDGTAWDLDPATTAVAIADNEEGESYGPHLAIQFMREFRERGGQAWPAGGPYPEILLPEGSQRHEGVLPYRREGTSHWERLADVCADPPDLIYFAGRSVEFEDFYTQIQEEGRCAEGDVTILGGDDIAKYVADNEQRLANAEGFPVYYTPLAASGPWSQCSDTEHSVYNELADLIDTEEGHAAANPDTAPSMAHAAVAYDGLRVLDRALLRDTLERSEEDGGSEDDEFTRLRGSLLARIQDTSGTHGPTGTLRFGDPSSGNWYDDQLVQLVLAGPESESADTGETEWQRVVAAHGRINETDRAPEGCETGNGGAGQD